MGSKKVASKKASKKPDKGVHKDLYMESASEPKTKGLFTRILNVVAEGHFQSPSQFVREACLAFIGKFEKDGKAKKLVADWDVGKETGEKIEVWQEGNSYHVAVKDLRENEEVVIHGSRWARNKSKKAVKATIEAILKPTKGGIILAKD